jgi:hypothetical protein
MRKAKKPMRSVLAPLKWILHTADARDLSPASIFLCAVGLSVFIFYIQIFNVIFDEPNTNPLLIMVIIVAAFSITREIHRKRKTTSSVFRIACDILAAGVTVPFAAVIPPWFLVFLIHLNWEGLKKQAYWLYLAFAFDPAKLALAFLETPEGAAAAAFLAAGIVASICGTGRTEVVARPRQ